MQPQSDPRWAHIVGGVTEHGVVQPMTYEILAELAAKWDQHLSNDLGEAGPAALLRMARSLFAHSWFDYEFMVVACLIGFQAMEAAFRVLYPEADQVPFRRLVGRAHQEGILPSNIADLAETAVELRNLFSHPATQAALTVGMAGPMLENTHRMVDLVMAAAAFRTNEPQEEPTT